MDGTAEKMDPKATRSLFEHQVIAKRPWGSHSRDLLWLVSPRKWWGIATLCQIPVWPVVRSSLAQAILPAILYNLLYVVVTESVQARLPAPRRIIVPYLLSPWTVVLSWRTLKPFRQIVAASKQFLQKRAHVNNDAWACLASRIQSQRAYRTYSYDVYLPKKNNQLQRAILFLPGAGVPHEAYAHPAALLSDAGYLTVVVGMEPHLLATRGLGSDAKRIRRIQRQVESSQHSSAIQEWSLAGHSLGSFAATQLARPLGIAIVVMWGSAPFVDYVADDLKGSTDGTAVLDNSIHVLVVQASKDFLVNQVATPELTVAFWEKLPPNARKHEVFGGTHAGFADYTSLSNEEQGDISTVEQHEEVVRVTADFLREHQS